LTNGDGRLCGRVGGEHRGCREPHTENQTRGSEARDQDRQLESTGRATVQIVSAFLVCDICRARRRFGPRAAFLRAPLCRLLRGTCQTGRA
jgi:hypothetical protein